MSDLRLDRRQVTELNATVRSVRRVNDGVVLRCLPDGGFLRSYKPGQYTSIGLPRVGPRGEESFLKRAYSLADPILTDDRTRLIENSELKFYEFYISRVPHESGGREQLTPHLFELERGDRVFASTKIVGFHTLAAADPAHDVLFLSTGTGEAPHNSMIRQILSERRPIRLASLILGEPGWESAYQSTHEAVMTLFPHYGALFRRYESQEELLELVMRLLREPGFCSDTIGFPLTAESSHIFLCGDPGMIGAPKKRGGWEVEERQLSLVGLLNDNGFVTETKFQTGNITFEAYW